MKTLFRIFWIISLSLAVIVPVSRAQGRRGSLDEGSIVRQYLVSNGPKGPIHGGESAVTDMVLLADGWVYGSTAATWGGKTCHIFRPTGETERCSTSPAAPPNQGAPGQRARRDPGRRDLAANEVRSLLAIRGAPLHFRSEKQGRSWTRCPGCRAGSTAWGDPLHARPTR
jgi:hypothetical protein